MGSTKISKYNKLVGIFNTKYTQHYSFSNKSVKESLEIESSGEVCRLILVLQTVFYLPSIVLFLYMVGFLHYKYLVRIFILKSSFLKVLSGIHTDFFCIIMVMYISTRGPKL